MNKIHVLIEFGGEFDDSWSSTTVASFDIEKLEARKFELEQLQKIEARNYELLHGKDGFYSEYSRNSPVPNPSNEGLNVYTTWFARREEALTSFKLVWNIPEAFNNHERRGYEIRELEII